MQEIFSVRKPSGCDGVTRTRTSVTSWRRKEYRGKEDRIREGYLACDLLDIARLSEEDLAERKGRGYHLPRAGSAGEVPHDAL
ncbi:MAG TPA: hypothetical protein PKK74_07325 [Candidatus Methanoculleus thermohydrogenotrophicum]|jgi:hypothetical protein|nr:hypothetical protein [Candidatus Methanoculleus thermohydrogenotrophicum]NLM82226.1 hypothetical protein [Candidatus Methanoculleus thermohydrogenotrophicum]HOB18487.1 hypothetical protein [Candidatus Methanoculleus thermohydrogenotrophicum]HPZ38610.1 hypothetical protein [Candidatus Methanoculleus thermohydrogenotrophicum]HQC91755.1 hypothetical protein [Candidatus Methanoculleus thermohydrogenotrophicum]